MHMTYTKWEDINVDYTPFLINSKVIGLRTKYPDIYFDAEWGGIAATPNNTISSYHWLSLKNGLRKEWDKTIWNEQIKRIINTVLTTGLVSDWETVLYFIEQTKEPPILDNYVTMFVQSMETKKYGALIAFIVNWNDILDRMTRALRVIDNWNVLVSLVLTMDRIFIGNEKYKSAAMVQKQETLIGEYKNIHTSVGNTLIWAPIGNQLYKNGYLTVSGWETLHKNIPDVRTTELVPKIKEIFKDDIQDWTFFDSGNPDDRWLRLFTKITWASTK